MNLGIIGTVAKKVVEFSMSHSTEILTVCAVGGVVGTAITTGEAVIKASDTIKAHDMDEELKCEKIEQIDGVVTDHIVYYRERTFAEKAKLTWKCWVPPIFMGSTTIACILGSNHISNRRNLALAAAYSMSEESAKEFRNKVAESLGEKKVKKIENEIVQDHVSDKEVKDIIHTPYGEQLMYDDWSGRYFRSGQNEVEKKVNMLNKRMASKFCNSKVNDFYELIGLPTLGVGETHGWRFHIEDENPDVIVTFHPAMSPQGEACIGVRMNPEFLGEYYD